MILSEYKDMNIRIKDPVSGISHLLGAILSIIGTVILLYISIKQGKLSHIVSFAVFGASMIFLYSSSAIYHLFGHSAEEIDIFRKIDHAMIYVLIAGSYTPFCVIALRGWLGYSTITFIWILAVIGVALVFLKAFWHLPRYITTSLYTIMGWLSIIIIYPIYKATSFAAISWIFYGGLLYSLGAIIYTKKKPNLSKSFGFHEIFHILVLLGTLCHFYAIYKYLVPII